MIQKEARVGRKRWEGGQKVPTTAKARNTLIPRDENKKAAENEKVKSERRLKGLGKGHRMRN